MRPLLPGKAALAKGGETARTATSETTTSQKRGERRPFTAVSYTGGVPAGPAAEYLGIPGSEAARRRACARAGSRCTAAACHQHRVEVANDRPRGNAD